MSHYKDLMLLRRKFNMFKIDGIWWLQTNRNFVESLINEFYNFDEHDGVQNVISSRIRLNQRENIDICLIILLS